MEQFRKRLGIFGLLLAIISLILVSLMFFPGRSNADTLTWDLTDAKNYVVYQKLDGELDTAYKQISSTTVPLTVNTFTIPIIPAADFNKTFVYSVKAFNECGSSSDFSDPIKYNKCLTSIVSKVINIKIVIQPSGR